MPQSDLIVIYDELDLPLGTMRIRQRGSSAGHNGMESIIWARWETRSSCGFGWGSRPIAKSRTA